jgi:hypothetical protein
MTSSTAAIPPGGRQEMEGLRKVKRSDIFLENI